MVGWYHWLYGMSLSKLLEIVKDGEAWRAAVHGITKSRTQLSKWVTTVKLLKLDEIRENVENIYVGTVRVFSCFSSVWLFVTPWTVTYQAPLSMGFSRQEHWHELLCPPPGDLPDPEIELASACVSCIAGWFPTHWTIWEAPRAYCRYSLFRLVFLFTR